MNPDQIREIVREACEQTRLAASVCPWRDLRARFESIIYRAVERIVALAAKETTP